MECLSASRQNSLKIVDLALGLWHHDDANFIRCPKSILMFVNVISYIKLLFCFTLYTNDTDKICLYGLNSVCHVNVALSHENQLMQECGIFLLKGVEDKEQTSVRKLSSSDATSEKVGKYSSIDEA